MKFGKFFPLFLALLTALVAVSAVYAQEPTPEPPTDDEVNAIAKDMYCPVCENVPLDVCPTLACEQWREQIREKLALGWDKEQIQEYFVLQYGDRVLAEPPRRGLNWLVYIVPPAALLAGVFVLYRGFRSWRKPAPQVKSEPAPGKPPEPPANEYVARLEEELKKRD